MKRKMKTVLVAACAALLTVPMLGTAAEARTKGHRRHHVQTVAHHHHHSTPRDLWTTFEGERVDRAGWRLRANGWDNSCFNLPYLSSQFACTSNAG